MGIGTNTAEWKTTKRHICRSSYYWLSKLTTERLYYFVVKIYQNQIELQLFSVVIVNGSSLKAEKQNSWFLYRLYVRRPTSYGKRVGQKDKFVLPLLGSPFTRWMGATGGKKDQRPKSDEQVTSYHQKCQWKKIADFLLLKQSKPLDVKLFSIESVYSCVQTPKAGISIRWNKLACRSIGKRVSETRSITEITCSTACAKTIHYRKWDKNRWVKNYKTTHMQIELLLTFEIDNGKTLLFCC